jgi:hypothetical protein
MIAALIVPVPTAAALVDVHRAVMDPSYALGVPPHVTVMFPFGDPETVDLMRLRDAVRSVPAFATVFEAVDWFGEDVAWLRPADDSGFRRLTAAVQEAFPSFAPYGGRHEDAVPHLTIGSRPAASAAQLHRAAADVRAGLPVPVSVEAVHYGVLSDEPGSWRVRHRLALGVRHRPSATS